LSKKHPNNGPTLSKAPPKKRKRPQVEDDPLLDLSKPEMPVSPKSQEILAKFIEDLKDPAKTHRMPRKWTTAEP
jgi:hypothetical protein